MCYVTEFIVVAPNGSHKRYSCNDKGIPIALGRAPPRHDLEVNEIQQEKIFLQKIAEVGFNPDTCTAGKWLSMILQEPSLRHSTIISFAKFFSILLNLKFPREVYRRKRCCLFWIEQNLKKIDSLLKVNFIQCVYNQRVFNIAAPSVIVPSTYSDDMFMSVSSPDSPEPCLPSYQNQNIYNSIQLKSEEKKVLFKNDLLKHSLEVPDCNNPFSILLFKPLQACTPLDSATLDQMLEIFKRTTV